VIDIEELRAIVQHLHDGARREQTRMLHADGSPSVYSEEHRHFAEAYESVLKLIDGAP
jgi:hypothetical protein